MGRRAGPACIGAIAMRANSRRDNARGAPKAAEGAKHDASMRAAARTVNESGKAHIGSIASIDARPTLVGEQAPLQSPTRFHGERLAFNPRPDPPGVHDEFDF